MDKPEFHRVYGESRNGCNGFIRHPLGRSLRYSDGVQELAELGCYWLLDIVATEVVSAFRKNREEFHRADLIVNVVDNAAQLELLPTSGAEPAWKRSIEFTDMPDGTWVFYLQNEGRDGELDIAMILPMEY